MCKVRQAPRNHISAFNCEHYLDPTPYKALKKMDEASDEKNRLSKLVHAIHDICDLAGFEIEGRIILINKETGRKWK